MKYAFDTIADLQDKLNGMEDELKSIAHEYHAKEHRIAVEEAYTAFIAFRDALHRMDKHFEDAAMALKTAK